MSVRALENQTADGSGPSFRVLDRIQGTPTAAVSVYVHPSSVFGGTCEIFVEASIDGATWYELEGSSSSDPGTVFPFDVEAQMIRVSLRNDDPATDVTVDLASNAELTEVV